MAEQEEIKVGEALLDYTEQVTNIIASLGLAQSKLTEIINKYPEDYYGEADSYMNSYLEYLYGHIQKLILFYGNLAVYINGAFNTIEDCDEILSNYLENNGYVAVEGGD